jgi:hypothetical protein
MLRGATQARDAPKDVESVSNQPANGGRAITVGLKP